MNTRLFTLMIVVLVSACTMQTYAMREREHCRALVEAVESRLDRVNFSREVLVVYYECVAKLGEDG